MAGCCTLVGNFLNDTGISLPNGCFLSVNSNVNTEYSDTGCDEMLGGYTIGSLNLSGYAGTEVYTGCGGRAGTQVIWLRKYDCSSDILYFIYAGEGRSFLSEDITLDEISLNNTYPNRTRVLSASAQSGPTGFYTDVTQAEGKGMTYAGGPINFDTSSEVGCTLADIGLSNSGSSLYLQNFSIELVPGSIPVANYSFAYNP